MADDSPPTPGADTKATPESNDQSEPTGTVDGEQVSSEEDKANVDKQKADEAQEEKDKEQDARNDARYDEEAKENAEVTNDRTGRHTVPPSKPKPAPEEPVEEGKGEEPSKTGSGDDKKEKPAEEVRE